MTTASKIAIKTEVAPLAWRMFTHEDWSEFGGAERFEDGGDPLIADIAIDGVAGCVVMDAHGMFVTVEGYQGDDWIELNADILVGHRAPRLAVAAVLRATALMRVDMRLAELAALGFRDCKWRDG